MKQSMLNRLKYGNNFPTIVDWLIDNNINFILIDNLLICPEYVRVYKEENLYAYINLKTAIGYHQGVLMCESLILEIVKSSYGI